MASLSKTNGHYLLRFIGLDRKRHKLYLGTMPKATALNVKGHVEAIVTNAHAGKGPPDDTARWLAKLGDAFHDKLSNAGLCSPRGRATLKEFLDGYVASRGDVKASTATVLGHTRRCLIEYFGANKPLDAIHQGDADEFRRWLATHEGLSDSTVNRRIGIAKQFFRAAHRKRLIADNPFADQTSGRQANRARDYFLSRGDAAKILDACPDAEWRLIFALSRYAGLRCPSEHLGLTWADIDWERGRMLIRSPKTAHHEGKGERWVPLFSEVRTELEAVFDAAPEGSTHCVTRYRSANQNLRTQLQRIIHKAGLTAWPKLFANLRASRATELAAEFPAHVAAAWLGHSTLIASKHYWQVTDADFERATTKVSESESRGHKTGHTPNANGRQEGTREEGENANVRDLPRMSPSGGIWRSEQMGVTGLESIAHSQGNIAILDDVGPQDGPQGLTSVLKALASLTPEERQAISAILGRG